MKNHIKKLVWLLRIIIAGIFIFSALSKFCPWPCNGIFTFETKYIGSLGIVGIWSKILVRLLIGIELSIGILVLLPFYLKKYIIPFTVVLLSIFSIHLTIQIMNGSIENCGCFGQCISMSPELALVKNILSIISLVFIYKLIEVNKKYDKLFPLITTFLLTTLFVSLILLKCENNNTLVHEVDSNSNTNCNYSLSQLLLYLDPNCDHCEDMLLEIVKIKNNNLIELPEVHIIFGNNYAEETKTYINDLFTRVGQKFNYTIVSNEDWNKLFFAEYDTPGMKYIFNGNQLLFFEGVGVNKFNKNKLMEKLLK